MRKSLTRTMANLMAALAFLASCSDMEDNGAGRILFIVSSESEVAEVTKSSVGDYTQLPDGGDFTIVVKDSKGKIVYEGLVSNYPADKELVVGNYNVTASYGSVTDEGFGKPCFTGSQSFTVTGGSTNEVSIRVSLANSLVRVVCTDAFRNYYTSYSFTLKTGNGSSISFAQGETRAAFVDAYTISVEGELVNQGGKAQTFSRSYTSSLDPATCYTLKFDAGNIGSGTIRISFDNNVDDVNPGWMELNDKM
ncbi:MAG: DUF4493 domain-containing protein [Bacteroidales bacterium]|nr:DUF4493 domain-containing protein [Bacteroidales bacterium]